MSARRVICPDCAKSDLKSTVEYLAVARTLMAHYPYFDEEGRWHNHDPNYKHDYFKCSRGHEFSIARKCPHCDWPDTVQASRGGNQ